MSPPASHLHRRTTLKTTLLLDLDGTLLRNEVNTFLPVYLQAWGSFISPYFDPDKMVKALLAGTKAINDQPSADQTLRQRFDQVFYSAIDCDKEEFSPLEDLFYRQEFPKLKSFTQPVPGAVEFVTEAFTRGYQIAIATAPFFPLTAIEQRLAWAGLPVNRYPFAFVPSIETFHFGKPHTAFFAELLAHIGWPDGLVIMVGDDPEMDILPADQFGLPTFQVKKPDSAWLDNLLMPHTRGSLAELLNWVERLQIEECLPDLTTPAALLATLRSTPAFFNTYCRDMSLEDWICHPQPGEWCLAEIICHLRDVDIEVNIPRLQKILLEENPFLAGMDTDRWNIERNYHDQDGPQALARFTSARLNLLAMLDSLHPEGWQRTARHSIFGRTDLGELAGIIAGHDRLHIQQALQS